MRLFVSNAGDDPKFYGKIGVALRAGLEKTSLFDIFTGGVDHMGRHNRFHVEPGAAVPDAAPGA